LLCRNRTSRTLVAVVQRVARVTADLALDGHWVILTRFIQGIERLFEDCTGDNALETVEDCRDVHRGLHFDHETVNDLFSLAQVSYNPIGTKPVGFLEPLLLDRREIFNGLFWLVGILLRYSDLFVRFGGFRNLGYGDFRNTDIARNIF